MSRQTKPSENSGDTNPCGYWNDRGGWVPVDDSSRYTNAWSGSMTRLVRQLVWMRRASGLTPASVAAQVQAQGKEIGFPNLDHWAVHNRPQDWPQMRCSTSAEAAVKHAGFGVGHRWEGDGSSSGSRVPSRPVAEILDF